MPLCHGSNNSTVVALDSGHFIQMLQSCFGIGEHQNIEECRLHSLFCTFPTSPPQFSRRPSRTLHWTGEACASGLLTCDGADSSLTWLSAPGRGSGGSGGGGGEGEERVRPHARAGAITCDPETCLLTKSWNDAQVAPDKSPD